MVAIGLGEDTLMFATDYPHSRELVPEVGGDRTGLALAFRGGATEAVVGERRAMLCAGGGRAIVRHGIVSVDQRPRALRALRAFPPRVRTATAEPRPAVVA